ncbi:hypothetical protein GCM10025298_26020 [Natronobiforma cellulositropha]
MGSLLTAASAAGFTLSASGTFLTVTDEFVSLVGRPRAALLETSLSSVLAGEGTAETVLAAVDADAHSRPTFTFRTGGGDAVDCEVHLERVDHAGDENAALVGIVTGESPPSALGSSPVASTYGKTFAALAAAVPDGIIVLDTDSRIQYANPAVETILGYAPDDLVGERIVRIIPARHRRHHLEAVERYLETGERHREWQAIELPGKHRDGHEVPLGISLAEFVANDRHYFVGLFRDVSAMKEAQRTLAVKVSQQESVAYLAQLALETSDLDDFFEKVVEITAAATGAEFCQLLELDAETDTLTLRAGVGWGDERIGTDTIPATETTSQAGYTLCAGEPVVVEDLGPEARFTHPRLLVDHGIRSGITVVVGPADEPWGILGVHDSAPRQFPAHDVAVLQSVSVVVATAIERRRFETRLSETIDRVEASNERLEQFAYVDSHDLQEPLRTISGYLGLLEHGYGDVLGEDGREFVDLAVDGAYRMQEMVSSLLAYSRVETQGDDFERVDLDAVVEYALADLRAQVEETAAEVTLEPLPSVDGDASQLRQLFQNLLSNALEYAGEEPPRVHVSAERAADSWIVSVRDEGIGIDPDDHERVFDVFQRLHRNDDHPGTGIGLAMCKRIVERHGGEIRVDSTPGDGATFSVTLPASQTRVS